MTQPKKRVFILVGPPGAGKGTQAQFIADKYRLYHIDTGQSLRSEIASGSELGNQAKEYMDQGQLVPFELVMKVIKSAMLKIASDKQGYLFDGFPRNREQAKGLAAILKELELDINAVIYLDIPHEILMDRLAYRVTCSRCDAKYNLKLNPPKDEKICDSCNSDLIVRPDDRPEVIENRLHAYDSETAPLISYYESQGFVQRINAQNSINEVFKEIQQYMNSFFYASDKILM